MEKSFAKQIVFHTAHMFFEIDGEEVDMPEEKDEPLTREVLVEYLNPFVEGVDYTLSASFVEGEPVIFMTLLRDFYDDETEGILYKCDTVDLDGCTWIELRE